MQSLQPLQCTPGSREQDCSPAPSCDACHPTDTHYTEILMETSSMQDYAEVCGGVRRCAGACGGARRCAGGCGGVRDGAEVCGGVRQGAEVCGSVQNYAEACGITNKKARKARKQAEATERHSIIAHSATCRPVPGSASGTPSRSNRPPEGRWAAQPPLEDLPPVLPLPLPQQRHQPALPAAGPLLVPVRVRGRPLLSPPSRAGSRGRRQDCRRCPFLRAMTALRHR